MYTFSYAILTGLMSGLLTSGLTFIFYKFYLGVLRPWYIDIQYRGIRLDGAWEGGKKDANSEIKCVFNLKQSGFDIEGVFTAETTYFNRTDGITNYSNQYKVKGHTKNNIVILSYEAVSQQRTGAGVFVFKITHGGKELEGQCIHSEDTSDVFHMNRFTLKKSH